MRLRSGKVLLPYKKKEPVKQRNTKKVVRRVLNSMHIYKPELKFVDSVINGAFTTAGSFSQPLINILQGDTNGQMNGLKISITRIELRYKVTTTVIGDWCIGLLIDKEPNEALPTSVAEADVLSLPLTNAPFQQDSTQLTSSLLKNATVQDQYRYGPSHKGFHNLQIVASTEISKTGLIAWSFKGGLKVGFNTNPGAVSAVASAMRNYPLIYSLASTASMSRAIYCRVFYTDD